MPKKSKLLDLKLPNPVNVDFISLFKDESGITIGGICSIKHFHNQSCCEHVYADWSYIEPFIAPSQIQFPLLGISKLSIFSIKDAGFVVKLAGERELKLFVPCYNEQNGYYSSNLSLNISLDGEHSQPLQIQSIDISNNTKFIER